LGRSWTGALWEGSASDAVGAVSVAAFRGRSQTSARQAVVTAAMTIRLVMMALVPPLLVRTVK
jgi:hypothetical protein